MSTLLKRYLAYLLIPAGLVLLFLPLNTHRVEQLDKNFVFLEINETLVAETVTKPDSGSPLSASNDNAQQALNEQLNKMKNLFSEQATTINSYGYPVLLAEDLMSYPSLHEEVDDMMHMIALQRDVRSRVRRLDTVSIDEWHTFQQSVLGDSDAANFQYGNRIVKGHIKSVYILSDVEVENLRIACRAMGAVFLLLGFFALRGMYMMSAARIQIGKRSGMLMWDVITIGIGVVLTLGLLDSMLAKYFQTELLLGDERMSMFMGIFWIAFACPVLALFTTATGLQFVLITREGISVSGLFGQKTLKWSAVEKIRLVELYSARRVTGFFAPRKLAKILEISGESTTLHIMEPPYFSTKDEIINTLTTDAPDRLKDSISDLSGQWQSVW